MKISLLSSAVECADHHPEYAIFAILLKASSVMPPLEKGLNLGVWV
jgi:hypothetical protein